MNGRRRGFTLIELIVVLTIIGILLGLALPQYQNAMRKGREAVLKENLFQLRKLIGQYYTDKGKYPLQLQTLVEERYIREIPVDPMTGRADWTEVREEPQPDEIEAGMVLGIVDLRSASEAKAIDGTLYKTW